MTESEPYEVFALRYATRPSTRSDQFFRYDVYGEADGPQTMDYFFWVARNDETTVLVDCGFHPERGAARGRHFETDPFELLSRLNIAAEDVDHVVISHMHFDHVGNIASFPKATFSIAEAEYNFWAGPYGQTELTRTIVDAEDLETLEQLKAAGRLRLVNGPSELVSGIRLQPLGGHAPGQIATEVDAGALRVIVASDTAHYYEAFRAMRPIKLFHDLEDMYSAFAALREYESQPATVVAPGHDPLVGDYFDSFKQNCIDLTAPKAKKDRIDA